MRPLSILETCIYADNLDKAERFYCTVLGLKFFARQENRHVFLQSANAMFLVFNPDSTLRGEGSVAGRTIPSHGAKGPGHIAFSVEAQDLPQWRKQLAKHHVDIESEVLWPGDGISLYFRDPAGNSVELATANIWNSQLGDNS